MTKKELITAIIEARPEEFKETVLHKMKKAELEEIHGRIYFGDSSIAADAHEAVESQEIPVSYPETVEEGKSGTKYRLVNYKGVEKKTGLSKAEAEKKAKLTGYSVQEV